MAAELEPEHSANSSFISAKEGLAAPSELLPQACDNGAFVEQEKKHNRFNFVSENQVKELSVLTPPKTTTYSIKWAVKNFTDWRNSCNESYPDNVPDNLWAKEPEEIGCWLSFFVTETRNTEGNSYPPKTLYQLLSGLLHHSRSIDANAPNFLDKSIPAFKEFHCILDNLFKTLRKEGIGCEAKHAETISKEEESRLWDKGVLNVTSPKGLLRAVFYYNFCLHGGSEHRDLKLSQFMRLDGHYSYTSKNHQGRLSQLWVENKRIPIFRNENASGRCHVYILDTYISKLPEEVTQNDFFYARPLMKPHPHEPWYAAVPVGKNMLSTMLKNMCSEANIPGHKTNHSLRATGASELFEVGIPEKIIKERTGHRSLEALRLYERTTCEQQQAVSMILSADKRPLIKRP